MNISEFAIDILRKYAEENHTIVRGTSDLSPMEEWLIKELHKVKENALLHNVSIPFCKCNCQGSESDCSNER